MGLRIRVYRNLNNGKLSIQDARSKLILGHCDQVAMQASQFIVSEAGRQRVLASKRKQVHAYVEGSLEAISGFQSYRDRVLEHDGIACDPLEGKAYVKVRYNPYLSGSFMDEKSAPMHDAKHIIIRSNGQMLATL